MIRKNKSLGQWYGYKIDGVYASQHEINEQGLTEVLGQKIASIRPGDYRFRDQNGDGKITSADLVLLGSGEPDFTGGLTNTVSYKNLSLSVAMQFSYGATVFNANLHSLTSGRDGHNQIAEMNTKSWSPMVTYSLLVTTKPNIVCRVGWHSTTVRPRCLKTVRSSVLETSRWPMHLERK